MALRRRKNRGDSYRFGHNGYVAAEMVPAGQLKQPAIARYFRRE